MELKQEQICNLVKYAMEKSGRRRGILIQRVGYYPECYFDDEDVAAKKGSLTDRYFKLLENGTWEGKAEYIAWLFLALRIIVPLKIKLKSISDGLPSREKMEELMQWLYENLVAYKDFILAPCRMPGLASEATIAE